MPNVKVVLRHFHQQYYESSLLWFFYWRGLRSLLAIGEHDGDKRFTWFGPLERNTLCLRGMRVVLQCAI
jgi:hypothetical protein